MVSMCQNPPHINTHQHIYTREHSPLQQPSVLSCQRLNSELELEFNFFTIGVLREVLVLLHIQKGKRRESD